MKINILRVDIAELYPLLNQANSEFMNIAETAEALTLYRCFYKVTIRILF
jgi:hypothetical protein